MREIKFRAWDKVNKFMCCGAHKCYDTLGCEDKCSFCVQSFGDLLENKDIPLMQYTGLKDKRGVEIFEGDILKLKNPNGRIREVIWKQGIGQWCMGQELNGLSKTSLWEFTTIGCEVIGNIYENPELKEKK